MRAARVLSSRPERAIVALAELCEERKDEDLVSAPPYSSPRASLPPQTPYTVGSQSMRPKGAHAAERLSPPTKFFEPGPRLSAQQTSSPRPPPEHMAPKRSKWTSPPPAEAPSADHSLFESQLGMGLELATSSSEAREKGAAYNSSSSNSEFLTDEDRSDAAESDDVSSVRSFTEGLTSASGSHRRPSWHVHDTVRAPQSPLSGATGPPGPGRYQRLLDTAPIPPFRPSYDGSPSSRSESSKRSIPRPARGPSWPTSNTPVGVGVPLPPSPESPQDPSLTDSSTVFYQTTVPRSPRPNVLYPSPGLHSSLLSQYQTHHVYHNMNTVVPPDIFPPNLPASLTSMNPRAHAGMTADIGRSSAGPETPTPTSYSYSHSHSLSSATITASTPPPHIPKFSPSISGRSPFVPSNETRHQSRSCLRSSSRSRSRSRSPARNISPHAPGQFLVQPSSNGPSSPHLSSTSNGSSPTPSSTGYATSVSRSPSPHSHSPSPPPTAMPAKEKPDEDVFSPAFAAKIHDGSPEPPTLPQVPLADLPLVEASIETQAMETRGS